MRVLFILLIFGTQCLFATKAPNVPVLEERSQVRSRLEGIIDNLLEDIPQSSSKAECSGITNIVCNVKSILFFIQNDMGHNYAVEYSMRLTINIVSPKSVQIKLKIENTAMPNDDFKRSIIPKLYEHTLTLDYNGDYVLAFNRLNIKADGYNILLSSKADVESKYFGNNFFSTFERFNSAEKIMEANELAWNSMYMTIESLYGFNSVGTMQLLKDEYDYKLYEVGFAIDGDILESLYKVYSIVYDDNDMDNFKEGLEDLVGELDKRLESLNTNLKYISPKRDRDKLQSFSKSFVLSLKNILFNNAKHISLTLKAKDNVEPIHAALLQHSKKVARLIEVARLIDEVESEEGQVDMKSLENVSNPIFNQYHLFINEKAVW